MSANVFELNEQTLTIIEALGGHMPGGFFIYRAEAPEELLYANKPVFDIFGCASLEEFKALTGCTFRGMVHPEDYERITASIEEQIEQSDGKLDYAEYRIIRKDGAIRWVDDFGRYLDTEKYGGVYTVFISDITEKHERLDATHKATLDALNKAHAERITFSRVAQALAGDYFCIYVVDPDTEDYVEYSSNGDYDRLGLERGGGDFFDLSRRNMDRLMYPEDKERFMAVFTKERVLSIIRRDGIFTTKYRLMIDGEPVYISMKASLLEDEDGCHLIIGTNNIDAQMKREQDYQRRMAEARDRAKNDFLANMSHDIRTPMNAIVGYTNIAASHIDDPSLVRDSLDKIASSSHFLLSLINDVLDMSKIENGKMQLNIAPCDLSTIFHRIEDITSLQAQKKSQSITYQKDTVRHFHVLGDELRIEQILINIISNAIKYTPEGKSIDLIAEELTSPEPGKIRYRFTIRDTGVGISEEFLPHIFDSFSREQNTTVNRIQGTGLGLAITAKVVEQMGGAISVKSKLGEGSEFTVVLDLESLDDGQGSEGADAEADFSDLAGRRVLLVEDNDINAEIAELILSMYGLATERAEHGLQCLHMLRDRGEGYYDAILMDIQMPVMNGYEAVRAIRETESEYYRHIPIIAVSANCYEEDVRQCLDSGMNAHIAKPFDPEDLMKKLQAVILHR